jgi:molybdopterin converting factor small subunit
MITIQIRYFGALREVTQLRNFQKLSFPGGVDLLTLRRTLVGSLAEENGAAAKLIGESAFSNEDMILDLRHRLESDCTIFLLPPVCGG